MGRLKLSGGVVGRGTESTDSEYLGSEPPAGVGGAAHGVFFGAGVLLEAVVDHKSGVHHVLEAEGKPWRSAKPRCFGKPSRPYLNASGQSDGNYCWPCDSMYGWRGSFPFGLPEKVAQRVR